MKFLKVENLKEDFKAVSLNRPEVKNAFNPEMISEITETFKSLSQDKKVKAIILKGEGSVFCSGADLNWMKEMAKYSFEENMADTGKLWDMFEAMAACEVPVIGLIQGGVFGGAVGLVACCDYVVAEEDVKFCFSEVKLGLAPAVVSSFVLKKIPEAFVRPYLINAEVFSSKRAYEIGLVHEVATHNLEETIKKFSGNGIEAMRETKKLLNKISSGISWAEQKNQTTKVISERRASAEAQTRLQKFLSKT